MAERKMTEAEHKKAAKLARKLRDKKNITNPHALARWIVQRKTKKP